MRVDVTVSVKQPPTARMRQVSAMFDAPIVEKAERSWQGDVPIEDRPWSIGLIVGPSGAGKSTVARQMFGEPFVASWDNRSIVDNFDASLPVDDISKALSAVGFNSIPAWCRPHGTLSNGEKFRADLARMLVSSQSLNWIDEFTSVVDRQVAKIGSFALARYVRASPGRQVVAVGCHYDVIDWLQPDWTLEPTTMAFTWRSLQPRPHIDAVIRRCPWGLWSMFAPYHYMNAEMHQAARCFAIYVDDRPIAFASVLPMPVSSGKYKGTAIARVSRIVVLPDWQGLGLVFRMVETLARAYTALGKRFRCYPGHPSLIRAHVRKPELWNQIQDAAHGMMQTQGTKSTSGKMGGRPVAVFEWKGDAMDLRDAERLIATG